MKALELMRCWAGGLALEDLDRGYAGRGLASWLGTLWSHGELAAVRLEGTPPVFLMADGPSPHLTPLRYRNIRRAVAARPYFLPFSSRGNRRSGMDTHIPKLCENLAVEASARRFPGPRGGGMQERFALAYPDGFTALAHRVSALVVEEGDPSTNPDLSASLLKELLKAA